MIRPSTRPAPIVRRPVIDSSPRLHLTALPVPLTPLVGREHEIAAVVGLLGGADVRLVTLTGPGGVGKSRLAIAVAAAVAAHYRDGVVFVPLAAVTDPALVPRTIARVLELPEIGHQPVLHQLGAVLRERRLLLVLDNFEQVVEAATALADLLGSCPNVQALVASRSLLRLTGEHDFPVAPLLPPPAEGRQALAELAANDALVLFVARARAANPAFTLTAENAPTIAEICRRLDGLPLAIELAAVWVRVLSCEDLLARLSHRLTVLTGGARDQLGHHQTMRDAIAWSHDLLSPDERTLFRRLAVFAGGFSVQAAETVCAEPDGSSTAPDVLSGIASLAEKSLVQHVAQSDGAMRLRMLDTIREFGQEQRATAGETDATMRRLAGWCQDLLKGIDTAFFTTAQRHWVQRLEPEHDNLRAVVAWVLEQGDAPAAQRLVEQMAWFWIPRGYFSEGRNAMERALALGDAVPTPERALALPRAGTFAWQQGDYRRARELAEEGLVVSRQVGHAVGEGSSHLLLGWVAEDEGRFGEAENHLKEARRIFQTEGWTTWVGFALNGLGVVSYERGDVAEAAIRFEDARKCFLEAGNTYGIGFVLTNLAKTARNQGDYPRAVSLYSESLMLLHEQEDKQTIAGNLRGLATVAAATRQFVRAARLWGAAEALREAIGAPPPHAQTRAQDAITATRRGLGEEAFAASWESGRTLTLGEAVTEALTVPNDASGTAPITAAERHDLTAREFEVLGLLVEGRTNPEIADRLFISRRTVTTHVTNIFAKLGVGNRVEAVDYAHRYGLIGPLGP